MRQRSLSFAIAFVSQALAVLRPLFPAKTGPPLNSWETLITGNGSIQHTAKRTRVRRRGQCFYRLANTQAFACVAEVFLTPRPGDSKSFLKKSHRAGCNSGRSVEVAHVVALGLSLLHCCVESEKGTIHSMNPQKATIVILATLFVSLALAEDFKTVSGKIYKDATISRVEADGIVLRTKTGISKVYFVQLPKDVQERFHYGSATPTGKAVTQRIDRAESANHAATFIDAGKFADRFAQQVAKSSTSGNRSYRGNTRPARQSRW